MLESYREYSDVLCVDFKTISKGRFVTLTGRLVESKDCFKWIDSEYGSVVTSRAVWYTGSYQNPVFVFVPI